jgi:hypothetical protein
MGFSNEPTPHAPQHRNPHQRLERPYPLLVRHLPRRPHRSDKQKGTKMTDQDKIKELRKAIDDCRIRCESLKTGSKARRYLAAISTGLETALAIFEESNKQ